EPEAKSKCSHVNPPRAEPEGEDYDLEKWRETSSSDTEHPRYYETGYYKNLTKTSPMYARPAALSPITISNRTSTSAVSTLRKPSFPLSQYPIRSNASFKSSWLSE